MPRTFYTGHEKFKRTVEQVKKLGLNPLKYVFLTAVQVLAQISKSTQERKCNVFKDWGWSDEEIVSAFGRFPNCIQYSEHKIKATMDFFVNTMGLKSSYIANNPQFLSFSLKKRIIPRFAVFQSLLSKGLIKKEISISTLLSLTENKFLQMFVIRYDDPHLLKLYEEKLGISKCYYFTLIYFVDPFLVTLVPWMMLVALTPNHQFAAIVMSFLLSFWNLFSGFLIPRTEIPIWWRWYYWASPVAWTIYGLVSSQVGDKLDMVEIPGALSKMTVKDYLKTKLGFDYNFLPYVIVAHIGWVLLFLFVFA
ncbi:Mitochodrial transcription termination factor-related protein [Corchorus olitorius]|uniref:Mitochodrial transcription termination factor-related protein n=1 Tax=Corchorus olitorius TaxID=93759 RepID=A0A1R3J1R8_9ROSI|nr:Mitochodrial transcription termination factor-related protein [Corchorus olitorius]